MGRPRRYTEDRVATAIRFPVALHRRLVALARKRRQSVNEVVVEAVEDKLDPRDPPGPPAQFTARDGDVLDLVIPGWSVRSVRCAECREPVTRGRVSVVEGYYEDGEFVEGVWVPGAPIMRNVSKMTIIVEPCGHDAGFVAAVTL